MYAGHALVPVFFSTTFAWKDFSGVIASGAVIDTHCASNAAVCAKTGVATKAATRIEKLRRILRIYELGKNEVDILYIYQEICQFCHFCHF